MSRDYDDSDTWRPHSSTTHDGGLQVMMNGRGGAARALTPEEVIEQRRYELERRRLVRLAKAAKRGEWIEDQRRDYLERCAAYTLFDLNRHRTCVATAFGRLLRKHRLNVGYSQEELAAIIGFDRTYPSLLERGLRCPTLGVANSIAIALRVPPVVFQAEFQDALRDEVKAFKILEKRLEKMNERAKNRPSALLARLPPPKFNRQSV